MRIRVGARACVRDRSAPPLNLLERKNPPYFALMGLAYGRTG